MSSLAFLVTELQTLASETRRKHPEVREAAEKSLAILRASPEQATANLSQDGAQSEELLRPVFMGCSTRNAKVVAISLGSLQRLIAMKAVPLNSVPLIVTTMADCISQGVDIQLRILQTLLSLLTNYTQVHGDLLGSALLLCFRLQESRIAVVSSTAAATLRQLVMFVFDKVIEADRTGSEDPLPDNAEKTELPDGTLTVLHPSARDAYSVFEDLCLLANLEHPLFLKLDSLPKTFSLELIESVLTNYHALFRQRQELLLLLRHHLCPMLHKSLSDRPLFPLTLRSTRVVFLLLKQFSRALETEAEVFLTLLIKVISGDGDANDSARPHWMRVLAMEIIRGLCSDAELIRSIWERYDAKDAGSNVFTSLITALKRLATEKPALLGVGTQMFGVGVQSHTYSDGGGSGYGLDVGTVAGMVASAASATVSGVVGMIGSGAGLSVSGSSMKLQCIDQLDKADSPIIPESYIFLLALQCLVSLSEGFASLVLPLYTTLVVQRPRAAGDAVIRAPPALDIQSLSPDEPSTIQLRSVHSMIGHGWPALLAALSFFISTNLSDELFADVLSSIQNLSNVSGVLGLFTPRDAFLTSLAKFAIPSGVVSSLDSYVEPSTPRIGGGGVLSADNLGLTALAGGPAQAPGLSERNVACLKVLITTALFLAGSLGPSWFDVLETLQNAEYVLFLKGARAGSTSSRLSTTSGVGSGLGPKNRSSSGAQSSGVPASPSHTRSPLMSDLDLESVQTAMARLFDASKNLDDDAFKHFVTALCKLSAAMVGMQSNTNTFVLNESSEDFGTLSPPMSPTKDSKQRRRASGIHLSRTMRGGDYGIAKLGSVSLLNVQRLIYRDPEIAWNAVTSHLLSVIRNPLAPGPIRLQAAEALDDILVIVPRHLTTTTGEIQGQVQQRVLLALSQQISVDSMPGSSATTTDVRRMGLETLHQILQFSGHTLVVGWETIFGMLSSVCMAPSESEPQPQPSEPSTPTSSPIRQRPPPLNVLSAKHNTVLVRIAFQSLTLVCDSVDLLTPEHLRLCISTLGQFGRQMETNIALTAAESLLWGVSDSIQSKRKDAEKEPIYSSLWMFLLLELLGLCGDDRPEVRNGAIQTLFRSMQLYGATLGSETWDECLWKIIFPLLDSISSSIDKIRTPGAAIQSYTAYNPTPTSSQSWDETKSLTYQLIASIFNDFLVSQIIRLPTFNKAWDAFVTHVTKSALQDHRSVSTAALKCLDKGLVASRSVDADFQSIASDAWERVWASCDELGDAVVRRIPGPQSPPASATESAPAPFTQESLQAFVDVIRTTYSLNGSSWDLSRIHRALIILKDVLTYSQSPDYRPDIDALTPVQAVVVNAIADINLDVKGSPSLVLCDLSEFATLPFVAAFDVPEKTQPTPVGSSDNPKRAAPKRVTYIALSKYAMPKLVELYQRFEETLDIYIDGTIERLLSAYSIPIKLKYDCPAPSKFGNDPPLWKTATVSFLRTVKELAKCVNTFSNDLPGERVEGIWRQVLDVFRGGLLADCSAADQFPLQIQEAEEKFDLALIATLEIDVIPHLGDSRVPDSTIIQLSKTLQNASRLHDLDGDIPSPNTLLYDADAQRNGNSKEVDQLIGTTAPATLLPRERFSYWCFDLLFLICSNAVQDRQPARRRVAALCIPALLRRIHDVLASYVADEALRGSIPFARAQEEELLYVLRKSLELRLWDGSLWAAFSDDPSRNCLEQPPVDATLSPSKLIADSVKRSPRAHLFHFYTLLYEIATVPRATPSAWIVPSTNGTSKPSQPPTTPTPKTEGSFAIGTVGAEVDPEDKIAIEVDARHLAKQCLQELGKEMGAEI